MQEAESLRMGTIACSSSPISSRLGSVERVVLPEPERPKKMAVAPFPFVLAEQSIEAMPFSGILCKYAYCVNTTVYAV